MCVVILYCLMFSLIEVCVIDVFVFFKQKTAYELRISDWSSDVCSSDLLGEALGDHLGLAMEEFDFEADELADIVGDHWAGVLWGCAFEDLLTRTIQPDRNIVDDYIRRRGWNESGPTKIYLRALRSSVMSLHEVSEVEPGSGFLVRDLIRGGEPLRVSERSASQTLKQWDRIGARVVQVGGKHLLSGGVLSFTMEAAEALVADLRRSKGK